MKSIINFFKNITLQLALIIWGIVALYPIIWLIYSSLKTNKEIYTNILSIPLKPYFGNYLVVSQQAMIEQGYPSFNFLRFFANTMMVSVSSIAVIIIISLFAAYGISQFKIKGKNIIVFLLIGIMGIPTLSIFISLYVFISNLGLINNYFGLILPYIAFGLPFAMIVFQTFFRDFPVQLIEAARIDGCSELRIIFKIVFPMSKGIIVTVAILNFISLFNEFLLALIVLSRSNLKTISLGLLEFNAKYSYSNFAFTFAAIVLSLIPTLLLYIIFNKYVVESVGIGMKE